ncbi:MAG: histidine kinase [Bacteroidales bacterium]|nr:histidine kinase [Bacteroidales bacterium]
MEIKASLFRICFIIFLISCLISVKAQFPFSIHYTVNDGLPSSEILDISQDCDGHIWFATTYGLCRFDGYEFKSFPVPEIPDQSFILICKGSQDKLWFLTYTGYLCYLHERQLYNYQLNDSIRSLAGGVFLHSVRVDTLDRIWFKGKAPKQLVCIANDSIIIIDTIAGAYSYYPSVFYDFYDQGNNINQGKHLYNPKENNLLPGIQPESDFYQIQDKLYKLGSNNQLVYSGKITPEKKLRSNRSDIYQEPNGNIWLRKNFKGAILYRNGNLKHPELYLTDERLTRILKDREGNYWFATEGNGVYLVPSFQFKVFPYNEQDIPNDNIIAFDFHNDQVIFSTNDNKIFKGQIRNGQLITIRPFIRDDDKNLYGRDILWQEEGPVWITQSSQLRYSPSGQPLHLNMIILHKPYEVIELHDGSVAVATIHGFYIYKNGILVFDSRKEMFFEHIQAIYEDHHGKIWLGTVSGLYSYHNGEYLYWGNKSALLAGRIACITGFEDEVWVGTREQGIAIITNDSIMTLGTGEGLNSNIVKSIYISSDSLIWVGTNNGLNKINLHNSSAIIEHFTVWDGLPSNEINDIKSHGSYIWLATNNGIVSFQPEKIKKSHVRPKLYIHNIIINDRDTLIQSHYHLKPSQNNIRLEYTGISFRDPGNIRYNISFEGLNLQSYKTTSTSTTFPDLSPGEYNVTITACNTENYCSIIENAVSFQIDKYFTETNFFRIGLIILIIGVFALGFWLYFKGRKNKERIKREILQSEQKALRSQMNPHFIFNSLNSIQYFMLENEHEDADAYLANFSSLMRLILENSKQNFITLKEELETISLYLILEKLRVEDKFEYNILIDNDIDPEILKLPPMILQPYLENAIWHGIMPRGEKGRIDISVSYAANNVLDVSIEDNGIGREKAAKISEKRKGHRSTGMKNIEERIKLINKLYKTRMEIKITDLFDEKNQPAGTRINILIPTIAF